MSRSEKDFDYQLDLTPFISLLSVCICFLLLTVAWFQIGSLSVRQVMGGDTSQGIEKEDTPSVWIYMNPEKRIEVRLKKGQKALSQKLIKSSAGGEVFNFKEFKKYIVNLKNQQSDLNKAFIFPQEQVLYEDIVKIMDGIRHAGIFSMGLSPI